MQLACARAFFLLVRFLCPPSGVCTAESTASHVRICKRAYDLLLEKVHS
jgi:hypothetical protein